MGVKVYANNRAILGEASDGKYIATFPDVCFTPAPPPPGVPIPYPNTAFDSDLAAGSTTVQVHGKPAALKGKSYLKTSTGDEPGSAPKKGAVTTKIKGRSYFQMGSSDVFIEGKSVVRHLDIATQNHASSAVGNTPPGPNVDHGTSPSKINEPEDPCKNTKKKDDGNGLDCEKGSECEKSKKCILKPKKQDKSFCCSPDTTGHHLVEVHCFFRSGGDRADLSHRLNNGEPCGSTESVTPPNFINYKPDDAYCVCTNESASAGKHKNLHAVQRQLEVAYNIKRKDCPLWIWSKQGRQEGKTRGIAKSCWTYAEAREVGCTAHEMVYGKCDKSIQTQLDDYHVSIAKLADNMPLRSAPGSTKRRLDDQAKQEKIAEKIDKLTNGNSNGQQSTIVD